MPTDVATPCPSGPVVVSTPDVQRYSGWPGQRESSCRKRLMSSSGTDSSPSALVRRVDRLDAGEVQQRVQQHRGVPRREHEAVAVRPDRVVGVEAQEVLPQRVGDRRHRHRRPGMARVRRLHGVHRERADGGDGELVRRKIGELSGAPRTRRRRSHARDHAANRTCDGTRASAAAPSPRRAASATGMGARSARRCWTMSSARPSSAAGGSRERPPRRAGEASVGAVRPPARALRRGRAARARARPSLRRGRTGTSPPRAAPAHRTGPPKHSGRGAQAPPGPGSRVGTDCAGRLEARDRGRA